MNVQPEDRIVAGKGKMPYHHVDCRHLKGLKIELTEDGRKSRRHFAILGLSSQETIRAGLRAVDRSPFRTVFVVRETTGEVLFALSKNEEYVAAAKKKNPKPSPDPLPPPVSFCCSECQRAGGTCGQEYPDGSCLCWGAETGGGGGLDDPLETLAL